MAELQLKEKRMRELVKQRKDERNDLELEVARMDRMKKHMETMHRYVRYRGQINIIPNIY